MKTNKYSMLPDVPAESLAFGLFPEFLKWMVSAKADIDFSLKDGIGIWKDVYTRTVDNEALVEFGSHLTMLLNYIVEFDKDRGAITCEDALRFFHVGQGMILAALVRCDMPEPGSEVCMTKSFHV